MNRISETPDQYQRRRHYDFGGVVDPVVESHPFPDGHRDYTLCRRVPVDARYCTLLAEL